MMAWRKYSVLRRINLVAFEQANVEKRTLSGTKAGHDQARSMPLLNPLTDHT